MSGRRSPACRPCSHPPPQGPGCSCLCAHARACGVPAAARPSPPRIPPPGDKDAFPRGQAGRGPQGEGADQQSSRERPGAVSSRRPLPARGPGPAPLCRALTFVLRLLLLLVRLWAVPGAHLLLQGLQLALVVLARRQGCGSGSPRPPTLCAWTGPPHSQGSGQLRAGLRKQGPWFPHPAPLCSPWGHGTRGHGPEATLTSLCCSNR